MSMYKVIGVEIWRRGKRSGVGLQICNGLFEVKERSELFREKECVQMGVGQKGVGGEKTALFWWQK